MHDWNTDEFLENLAEENGAISTVHHCTGTCWINLHDPPLHNSTP